MQSNKQYSTEDLTEFKVLIQNKLATAQKEFQHYQYQLQEADEEDKDSWGEDMNISNKEMLTTLAERKRVFIRQLELALTRIKNKTYGVCEVTGELIDKRRLIAVPTTTKSLLAKNNLEQEKQKIKPVSIVVKPGPKIITKIIKKSPIIPKEVNGFIIIDDDDDDEDEYQDLFNPEDDDEDEYQDLFNPEDDD